MGTSAGQNIAGINFGDGEVRELRAAILDMAKDGQDKIIEEIQNGVIKPLSTCIFTPEFKNYIDGEGDSSITYDNNFKEVVKKQGIEIVKAYNTLIDNLRKSLNTDWAQNMGYSGDISIADLSDDAVNLEINTEAIVTKDGSFMGVRNVDAANNVANSLGKVEEAIKDALTKNVDNFKAKAEAVFKGYGQSTAMQEFVVKQNESIAKIFEFLQTGGNDQGQTLSSQIKSAVNKYTNIAEQSAKKYSSEEAAK